MNEKGTIPITDVIMSRRVYMIFLFSSSKSEIALNIEGAELDSDGSFSEEGGPS